MPDLTLSIPLRPEDAERLNALAEEAGCTSEAKATRLLAEALAQTLKPASPVVEDCLEDSLCVIRDLLHVVDAASTNKSPLPRTGSGIGRLCLMIDEGLAYQARLAGKSRCADTDPRQRA